MNARRFGPDGLQAASSSDMDSAVHLRPGRVMGTPRMPARRTALAALGIAAATATSALMLASLLAAQLDPAIVGAPASTPAIETATTTVAEAEPSLQHSRDRWLQCFYDVLASEGGTADGPGYQRADSACQRR